MRCLHRQTRSSGPAAPQWRSTRALAPGEILRSHPHLTVTSITPFGLEGPWSDKAATEFTLQAWSGAIIGLARGRPDRAPVFVGGQIGEWLSGVFGAIGTLAALPAQRRGRRARRRVDARSAGDVPHVLPGDVPRPAGTTDAAAPIRPHPGRRGRPRRPGRAGMRDRAAVARLLRDGRTPRVDGGSDALPRPHGAGADDRRLDRGAHRRGGARPRIGLPDPQRTDRQRRQPHHVRALPRRGRRSWRTRGTARRIRDHPSGSGRRAYGRPNRPLGSESTRSTRCSHARAHGHPSAPRRHPDFRSRGCACWT